jgi:hypothetical protein
MSILSQQHSTDISHKSYGLYFFLLLMIHGGGVGSDVGGSSSDAPSRSGCRWQERMSAASADATTQGFQPSRPISSTSMFFSLPISAHRTCWCATHCDHARSFLLCISARHMSFHPHYVITSSVVRCTVAYDWAVRSRSKSWDA